MFSVKVIFSVQTHCLCFVLFQFLFQRILNMPQSEMMSMLSFGRYRLQGNGGSILTFQSILTRYHQPSRARQTLVHSCLVSDLLESSDRVGMSAIAKGLREVHRDTQIYHLINATSGRCLRTPTHGDGGAWVLLTRNSILALTALERTVLGRNLLSEKLQTNLAFEQNYCSASWFREKDVILGLLKSESSKCVGKFI